MVIPERREEKPSLAPDSRPFQNKSSLTVVPLYFLGLLVLVDRVVYCLMKKEEARIFARVPHTRLCPAQVCVHLEWHLFTNNTKMLLTCQALCPQVYLCVDGFLFLSLCYKVLYRLIAQPDPHLRSSNWDQVPGWLHPDCKPEIVCGTLSRGQSTRSGPEFVSLL